MTESELPEAVMPIVKRAAAKYPDDIGKAVTMAERAIRRLEEFDDLMSTLVTSAIRELIHRVRHKVSTAIRREASEYGQPGKVKTGESESVNRVAKSVYLYHIAGMALGSVMGEMLPEIAETEKAKGDGCYFNARLATKLSGMVPHGKTVRQCVKETRLRTIFRECECAGDGKC